MSLNKFTDFLDKKQWMEIGCKVVNADDLYGINARFTQVSGATVSAEDALITSYKDYDQIGNQVATLDPDLVTYDLKTVFTDPAVPLRYFLTVRGSKNKGPLIPGSGFVDSYQLPSTITDRFGVKTAYYQISACSVIDYASAQMFPSNLAFSGTNNTLINIAGGFPPYANPGVSVISTFDITVELVKL